MADSFGTRFNNFLRSSWLLLAIVAAAAGWAARAELALQTVQEQVTAQTQDIKDTLKVVRKGDDALENKLDKLTDNVSDLAESTAVIQEWVRGHEARHDRRRQ